VNVFQRKLGTQVGSFWKLVAWILLWQKHEIFLRVTPLLLYYLGSLFCRSAVIVLNRSLEIPKKNRRALWKKIDRLVPTGFDYLWITCYSSFLPCILLIICPVEANKIAYTISIHRLYTQLKNSFYHIDFETVANKSIAYLW